MVQERQCRGWLRSGEESRDCEGWQVRLAAPWCLYLRRVCNEAMCHGQGPWVGCTTAANAGTITKCLARWALAGTLKQGHC